MQAEWNVYRIAEMSEEQNLRNLCRQIEQQYVDWNRDATIGGFRICIEWPQFGECNRYTVPDVQVRFVTTHKRTVQVQTPDRKLVEELGMFPGLAECLYICAGQVIDNPSDHCRPNGDPCRCAQCVAG